MPRGDDDEVRILSTEELPEAIREGFDRIYRHDATIERLSAKHLDPIKEKRTAEWRDLKKGTRISRKVLDAHYRLYKLERDADAMQDEQEAERVRDELRRAWAAIRDGETLDFITALDRAERRNDDGEEPAETQPDDEFFGDDEGDDLAVADLEPIAAEPPPAPIEAIAEPDADWGQDVPPPVADNADDAGHAHRAGVEWGGFGQPLEAGLKFHNKHARSIWATSFRAGYEQGLKQRTSADVVAFPGAPPSLTETSPVTGAA